MLGFFKKKASSKSGLSPLVGLLTAPDETFAAFVTEVFDNLEPAEKAHILVAREVMWPMLFAVSQEMKRRGQSFTVDDFLRQCFQNENRVADDPVKSRRNAWFSYAAMLHKFELLAARESRFSDRCAEIWVSIAEASPLLTALLPDNAVWKQEEKVYFDLMIQEDREDRVIWTVHQAMPQHLWETGAVERLADKHGFMFFAGAKRGILGPLMRMRAAPPA